MIHIKYITCIVIAAIILYFLYIHQYNTINHYDIFEEAFNCIENKQCDGQYKNYVTIRQHIPGLTPRKFGVLLKKRKTLDHQLSESEFDEIII